jgi:hypothetical protein
MATRQSDKVTDAGTQPKGLRVGLVAASAIYSVGAGRSQSAGDVIQMVRVPKGASLVYFQLSGGSGDALVTVGDGVDDDRYMTAVTMGSTSSVIRTLNVHAGNVPYVYSTDDTIDIAVSTVSVGTITGGYHMRCIFSMDEA